MKTKLPIGAIGLAFVVFFGYHKIHEWEQRQIQTLRAKISQEQSAQQLQAEIVALLQQVEDYRKHLPEEPDPSWLVQQAVAVGKELGVQLTTISQESPQQFPQFTRLAVTLQFSATYHQLGAFLDRLEQSDRFIQTERVDVSSAESGGPASVQVVLSTIYVPPPTKVAGG